MHRPTVGLIAIGLLAIGLSTYQQSDATLSAACLRVGVVMAILWFAQPQLQHVPGWLAVGGVAVLLIALRWPRLLVVALPLAVVLWMLRPREGGNRRF